MTLNKVSKLPFFISALILSFVFFGFTFFTAEKVSVAASDVLLVATLFSVLYLLVSLYFIKDFCGDILALFFIWAAAAALIYMRVPLLSFASRDYNIFLSRWLTEMRELKGVEPLVQKIGDYNMPYLYFLFIICNGLSP